MTFHIKNHILIIDSRVFPGGIEQVAGVEIGPGLAALKRQPHSRAEGTSPVKVAMCNISLAPRSI